MTVGGNDSDARTDTGTAETRVVIIGSGFGGYFAARRLGRLLRRTRTHIVLLSDSDGMLYAPLLPDVAVGALDPRAVTVPTATGLPGVQVLRGRATRVDGDASIVRYTDPDGASHYLGYDRLLVAVGSVTRLLDIPGLAEHAIGLKTNAEALYLRDHVLTQFETANAMDTHEQRRAALTFVVVGAGYAGTELAAQMARLTDRILPRYPNIHPDDVHWLLIDVAHAVMPELGPELGDAALALLRRRGVDVRLGTSLKAVTDTTITLTDDSTLDCTTVIWCAGITANPLIDSLGLPTTRGRLVVSADLNIPGHPWLYAIGDAAAVPDLTKPTDEHGDAPLCPPTAQHAMRQATAVARNIVASLGHGTARPYRHRDLGLVVDLGGPDAAATPMGIHLRGRAAKLVTRGYHLYALPSLNRRTRVVLDWALAARNPPDDIAFGLVPPADALITAAEDHSAPSNSEHDTS